MPGVVAVLTAADLDLQPVPPALPMLNQAMTRTWLASDRVRYVGEPVAVVLSTSREAGVDAAEAVVIGYEPLEVVATAAQALTEETLLFPEAGTNTTFGFPPNTEDDVLADGEVTVSLSFRNHRMTAVPLEPRAAVSRWDVDPEATSDGDGAGSLRLTQWSSTQSPHGTKDNLAGALGVDAEQIRVITPDVGGGFGAKNGAYPEDIVVAMPARHLGRPVRWTETRSENMVGMAHGRAQDYEASLAGNRDGTITGYKLHVVQDSGAYPAIGAVLAGAEFEQGLEIPCPGTGHQVQNRAQVVDRQFRDLRVDDLAIDRTHDVLEFHEQTVGVLIHRARSVTFLQLWPAGIAASGG